MKELLKTLCQKKNSERQAVLERELHLRQKKYCNLDDMAIVLPSECDTPVLLCAHFDTAPGSLGYNDNGMALVTILNMLDKLPSHVEVVFTNCEECGFLGARHYLACCRKNPRLCINLDVCGIGDMIYCDPMNSGITPADCKIGRMPPSDAVVFAGKHIPALCLSTSYRNMEFLEGIHAICQTIHGNHLDNDLDVINFDLPDLAADKIFSILRLGPSTADIK